MPQPDILNAGGADYAKTHLALRYSHRMAWDMVRIAVQKITRPEEIPLLPFAGLCCVFRAGLAVLETKVYVNEDVVGEDEIHSFRNILSWFAIRWSVGRVYLMRLQELQLQF